MEQGIMNIEELVVGKTTDDILGILTAVSDLLTFRHNPEKKCIEVYMGIKEIPEKEENKPLPKKTRFKWAKEIKSRIDFLKS